MSTDFLRGIFLGALFLIGIMLWNDWQTEHAPPVSGTTTNVNSQPTQASTTTAPLSTVNVNAPQTQVNAIPITVNTDVLQVKIDPVGGALIGNKLSNYPISLEDKSPYVLLNDKTDTFYTAQSGLVGPQGPDQRQAALYQAPQTRYVLKDGQDKLIVPLTWHNANGLEVTKTFTFTRNSYLVNVDFTVKNNSSRPWSGQLYTQFKRAEPVVKNHSMFGIKPFVGAVISSPDKRYDKLAFSGLAKEPVNQKIQNGWMAMEEHYFISAWIPDADQTFEYTSQALDNHIFALNALGPKIDVAAGQTSTISTKFYSGPAIASALTKIAPGLDLTVDYGYLWPIGKVLFWLLTHINQFVGNWGWSIVLLTVLIKICFYKLSATSYRSMAAMRKLQPQLQQLKERHGDDRQKLGQATMELYRKEKVNPMGGCLPMIVQIPVFFALYGVLLASVELRMAPFMLWIHDLASPDPYYVLPILMGLSMFIQQKMSPPPPDPMQAKVMMALPLVFTFFFLSFPAGLVLYWVVNSVLSIAQQWFITKKYSK